MTSVTVKNAEGGILQFCPKTAVNVNKQGRDLCYQMSYFHSFLCGVTVIRTRGFLMNLKIDCAGAGFFFTFIKCRCEGFCVWEFGLVFLLYFDFLLLFVWFGFGIFLFVFGVLSLSVWFDLLLFVRGFFISA